MANVAIKTSKLPLVRLVYGSYHEHFYTYLFGTRPYLLNGVELMYIGPASGAL